MSPEDDRQRGDDREPGSWSFFWREAMMAMTLGWELAVPIFVGVLVGHLLDQWLGTGYILTMGLLMAGIAAGYYSLARTIRRIEHRRGKKDNEK